MAQWLNKFLLIGALCLAPCATVLAQEEPNTTENTNDKDYKDPDQFDKFFKRRKQVGAWQINQLKQGALVVKLKTNKLLIDALTKEGKTDMAEKKRMEMLAMNLNLSRAFRQNYKFSKLYFVYSNYGDSLLNGKRSGCFLDSNLNVDPNIMMAEAFYIICESDNLYNSSIGFMPEDSARFAVESGNPTMTDVPIVLKNKYGHQLKRPFPISAGEGVVFSAPKDPKVYVLVNGAQVPYYINGSNFGGKKETYLYEGKPLSLSIPKNYTISWLSQSVENLDASLEEYYRRNPNPDVNKNPTLKPFLY